MSQPPHDVVLFVSDYADTFTPADIDERLRPLGLQPLRNSREAVVRRLDRVADAARVVGVDPFRIIDACLAWNDSPVGPWRLIAVQVAQAARSALAA